MGGKKCNNEGNESLRSLTKVMLPAYTRGSKEKKAIVDGLIADVAKVEGCFLRKKHDGASDSCEELDTDECRTKIMQMFRNLGRQTTTLSVQEGIPITDEPRPNDVVFGNLYRSRGPR